MRPNLTDYAAYIPAVNRIDLLQQAILNAWECWDDLTVIDNSDKGLMVKPETIKIHRGLVPMSFTQSMNWEFRDCLNRGKKYCIHMHSDSIVPEGAIPELLKQTREIDASGKKWGVVYAHYDILCIYNAAVCEEIGGFDTLFRDYYSDNDFYHRMELAGFERFNATGITVGHHGSQTVNSDPFLKFLTANITFPLARQLYVAKWGGEPDKEAFLEPFNSAWIENKIRVGKGVA